MSRENLPTENFFLLQDRNHKGISIIMDTPTKKYNRFFKVLTKAYNDYGRGFNKHLHHETGLSTSFLSLLLSGTKKASHDNQIKILTALGENPTDILGDNSTVEHDKKKYIIEVDDQETWQHLKTIKRFKNKSIAMELCNKLADFEEKDQWGFVKLLSKLDEYMTTRVKKEDRHTSGES